MKSTEIIGGVAAGIGTSEEEELDIEEEAVIEDQSLE